MAGGRRDPAQPRYPPPHSGEINEKGQVQLPLDLTLDLENGVTVAALIALMLRKSGQPASPHLQAVRADTSKAVRSTNWNFIW